MHPWRNWDKWKVVNVSKIQHFTSSTLQEINRAIRSEQYILEQLTEGFDGLRRDQQSMVIINDTMLNFVKDYSGGEGWIKLH
jgi:hypothetical protein